MKFTSARAAWPKYVVVLLIGVVMSTAYLSTLSTPTVYAAGGSNASKCKSEFFGLEPWFWFLDNSKIGADCEIKCFNLTDQNNIPPGPCDGDSDVPAVLLAVVDDMLRIAAFAAIAFVMYGAIQYVSSQGEPESTSRAQKTIMNALVGLALAITAVAIVSYLGKKLGG